MDTLRILQNDPWLEPYSKSFYDWHHLANAKEMELTQGKKLDEFASGYDYFGLHKDDKNWYFRDWAPNAIKIFLIGSFNNWEEKNEYQLNPIGNGVWEVILPIY